MSDAEGLQTTAVRLHPGAFLHRPRFKILAPKVGFHASPLLQWTAPGDTEHMVTVADHERFREYSQWEVRA
jgi:hypothetical protein